MGHSDKSVEQVKLAERIQNGTAPPPDSLWKHYKGDSYKVVCCSLMEDTLEPIVTYYSLQYGYFWTRTLTNWYEEVRPGVKRFFRIW